MDRIRVKKIQSRETFSSSSCKSVIISALQFLKTVMKAGVQCIRRNSIIFESEPESCQGDVLQVGAVPVTDVGKAADRLKDEEVFIKSSDEDVFESEFLKLELNDTKQSNSTVRERTRSLNAPSPIQQFGPCGRIMKNSAMVMTIQDPASQRLTWYKPPLTVLVIKKVRDAAVIPPFIQLVKWFINEKRMVVFVESAIMADPVLVRNPEFGHIQEKLMTFNEQKDDLTDKIDFVVCLGGDGTLLYASSLFQQSVPPIMAFHLGSLGFLTPFKFEDFDAQVTHVLEGHAALTLRSRLRCILIKKEEEEKGLKPATNQLVLNEVVIDRGPSPYLSNIDLYLDGKLITSVQGDGLIVSTPTGSTAYAVAAGASMIHPSVPAVMVTPICPHSLSFRPIVVPAGVELKITVSPDSRNTAWVSFDGRKRQELCHGDSLRVTTSIYPIPSICSQDQISDWFDSLAECLHWNVRKKQKAMTTNEVDPYAEVPQE